MSKIAPAPIRESIIDPLGNISRPWVQWFTDQLNRINERIELVINGDSGNLPLIDTDGGLVDSGYSTTTLPVNPHTNEDNDEGGSLGHGDLTGLDGDDHPQYVDNYTVVSKTDDYTADFGEMVLCDGAFTVNLPDITSENLGHRLAICNIGDGIVTGDGNSTDTIYGDTTIESIPNSTLVLQPITTSTWVLA